jgi:hypothetical protein
MRRRFLNFAMAMSLGLFVATATLWTRSHRTLNSLSDYDRISFTREDPLWWIISYPGKAVLCRQTGHDWNGHDLRGFQFAGMSFGGTRGRSGDLLWNLEVPYWMLCALTLAFPLIDVRRRWRERRNRRRQRRGLCLICGYDLRATQERCPECGNRTAPGQPAAA